MVARTHAGAFADGPAYEATLGEAHRYYMLLKARHLRRMIRRFVPGARRLVDLGCGTGQMEELLLREGFTTTGVDVAAPMIEHANAKRIPQAAFVVADAAATGLPSGAFDVAFATALFHHVPPSARPAVTREIVRLIRVGGLVVVFEHNPANPITRRMVRSSPVDGDAVLLHQHEMRENLEAGGLEVLMVRHLVFFPRMMAVFSRLEPLLGWLPFGGQYVVVARKPTGTGA